MLYKRSEVLYQNKVFEEDIRFLVKDGDMDLLLNKEVWELMHKPTVITVTIEPGNTL